MEELKISYSFNYLKEVFNYILIPVFIVLLIVVVGLFIYARKEKDHTTEKYQYTINFWSCLMCIVLSATLFAIALSFVVSLHNAIAGRPVDKSNLIYIVYISPLIPLLFLISTGYRWIKMFLKYKENKKDDIDSNNNDSDNNDDNNMNNNNDDNESHDKENNEENNIDKIIDNSVEVESVPLEKKISPIPVTLNNKSDKIVEDNSESSIPVVVEKSNTQTTKEKESMPDIENSDEIIDDTVEDSKENTIEEKIDVEDLDETKDIEVLDLD